MAGTYGHEAPFPGASDPDEDVVDQVAPEAEADRRTRTRKERAESKKAREAEDQRRLDLLRLAFDRFNSVLDAESIMRQEQLQDLRFIAGEQWEDQERNQRRRDKRPALTVNRLPQFARQVTGQMRAQRQAVQVNPVDDYSDPETAEVFQGIIRHIEQISHADVAYDRCADAQVHTGRGYIRILTEWGQGKQAFQQDIKIGSVRNPHSVYMDPTCLDPCYLDAMFGFVVADYTTREFKRRWPHAKATGGGAYFEGTANDRAHWFIGSGGIRVAEYFYVEVETATLVLLSDGSVHTEDEAVEVVAASMEAAQAAALQAQAAAASAWLTDGVAHPPDLAQIPAALEVIDSRPAERRVVRRALITGCDILEENVWPGRYIPIIPALGDEVELDGRLDYRGIVRDARDQQRLYNFMVTSLVETVGQAPRAPWIIAAGQLEGYEKYWSTAHLKSWAFLPYKAIQTNGTYAPPPQRNTFEPAIQAIVAAIQQADNDLKATTGFFDASLGERGPEQSGKAILARQRQGEIGSIHFATNFGRTMWALGTQLVDLIPKIYDAPRVMRITGRDDQQKTVMVHSGRQEDVPGELPKGVQKVYDLSVGTFDVVVGSGPSHTTRRQEAVEMMTQAVTANPNLLGIIGDLYFASMDWPMARKIAERLKKTLPPNLQDDPDSADIPPKVAAELAQAKQMLEALGQQLAEANETIRTKGVEMNAKERIALLEQQHELIKLFIANKAARDSEERQIEADREAGERQRHADVRDRDVARSDHAADRMLDAQMRKVDALYQRELAQEGQAAQQAMQREQLAARAQQGAAGPAGPGQPGEGRQ